MAAAAARADLAGVLATASRQRVAPLVLRALTAVGVHAGPGREAAEREAAFWRARAALGLPAVARHALVPLQRAGLTVLVHKGAALVGRYPEPGLRPMDDVDVILPAEQAGEAVAVLEAAGWSRGAHSLVREEPGYDVPLLHPETGGLPLELHYDLHRRSQRTTRVDAGLLWSERVPAVVCGQPVWGLPPEVELLALATHAAKPFHVFNRLLWAVDVAVLVGAGGLDWDAVARRTRELRCRTAVAVALRLARRLGAAVPDELVELPAVLQRSGALRPLLDPSWPFTVEDRNRRGMALALVDDGHARARLLVDEVRYPGSRSRGRVVLDQVRSAARLAGRAAFRRR